MSGSAPLFLAGSTGVGKSAVALTLAERLGGEIISVDSMQVYRGLDIGTAKASPEEQQRVRHHLIDVLDLHQTFDAAQFIQLAKAAVADIQARTRVPIFCGGTGLYFQVYLKGLGQAPPSDRAVRAALEKIPPSELLAELARRDPVTYQQIDRQNMRRIIRALEVIRLTDKPFSEQRAGWDVPAPRLPSDGSTAAAPAFYCLERESTDLYRRINQRVDQMFARGLVEETQALLVEGLATNPSASQALGYRQVQEFLAGLRTLPETIELVKQKTRNYAKRQLTWFRHQAQLEWLQVAESEPFDHMVDRVHNLYLARLAD